MHTPSNYEYIKARYDEMGIPVPRVLEALSEVYSTINGYTITGEKLYSLLLRLCKSYECYSTLHKPESEWDEYDQMMYPTWNELAELLEISK